MPLPLVKVANKDLHSQSEVKMMRLYSMAPMQKLENFVKNLKQKNFVSLTAIQLGQDLHVRWGNSVRGPQLEATTGPWPEDRMCVHT